MYREMEFTIRGVSPLLMHNGRLANPRDEFAKAIKAITSKRNKTDDDHEEISRLEFLGGMYTDDRGRPCVPGENIEAAFVEAGKKNKLGKQFAAGLICDGLWPVEYDGPKTADAMWKDGRFVDCRKAGIKANSVMRTRPIFREWSLAFTISYLPDQLDPAQILQALEMLCTVTALLDGRPKFGRSEIVQKEAA